MIRGSAFDVFLAGLGSSLPDFACLGDRFEDLLFFEGHSGDPEWQQKVKGPVGWRHK